MVERFKKIKRQIETEKNNSRRWMMSKLLITYYESLDDEDKIKLKDDLEEVALILEEVDMYDGLMEEQKMHLGISDKVIEKFHEEEFEDYCLYPENKLSLKTSDEIISEIVSDMGLGVDLLYKKLKDNNDILIKDQGKMGYCINGLGIDDSFIVIDEKIDKMVTYIWCLMHEMGHAYENEFMSMMPSTQQIYRYYYIFSEVLSSFFARVSIDYMINNRIYLDDTQRLLNAAYSDQIYSFLNLKFVIEAIKDGKCDHNLSHYQILDDTCFDDFAKKEERFEVYLDDKGEYSDFITYGYGGLLAEYFFDIYRKDKKEGMKLLKNFLSNQALLDDVTMIENLDLFNNDFEFLKKGLSENHTYMRKKYKW